MFRFLNIVWTSLKMAIAEFRSNKLRTFLSLLGIHKRQSVEMRRKRQIAGSGSAQSRKQDGFDGLD